MKKAILPVLIILLFIVLISCEEDTDDGFDLAGIWDYSGDTAQFESVMTINDSVTQFFEETTTFGGAPYYYTNTYAVDAEDNVNYTYILRVIEKHPDSGLTIGDIIYCSYAVIADNQIRIYMNEVNAAGYLPAEDGTEGAFGGNYLTYTRR